MLRLTIAGKTQISSKEVSWKEALPMGVCVFMPFADNFVCLDLGFTHIP